MLHELYKIHKRAALIHGNGFAVDCILKPTASHSGYSLKGLTSFIGVTFDETNAGAFGDSFELTIDLNDLTAQTNQLPTRAWGVEVKLPQMNNEPVGFKIENVAFDRTLGLCLIKCSANTSTGNPKAVERQISGGM